MFVKYKQTKLDFFAQPIQPAPVTASVSVPSSSGLPTVVSVQPAAQVVQTMPTTVVPPTIHYQTAPQVRCDFPYLFYLPVSGLGF